MQRASDQSIPSLEAYGDESESAMSVSIDSLQKRGGNRQSLEQQLVGKETTAVRFLRILMFIGLIVVTILVSYGVYVYTRNDENEKFEETYHDYSTQIQTIVNRNAQQKLEAIAAIALQIQASAVLSNSTWPNVTAPYFEEKFLVMQSLTDAYGIQLFPVVTSKDREGWEAYAIEQREWINQSYGAQRHIHGEDHSGLEEGQAADPAFSWYDHLWGTDYYNQTGLDFSSGISDSIFGTAEGSSAELVVDETDAPYFPQWQAAPMSSYYQSTVNFNYGNYEDFRNQTQLIMKNHTAAYGMAWQDGAVPGYISTLLYPVFQSFYQEEPEVKAFVGADLLWEAFLVEILPPNADGIHVVIQNAAPCNQTFTFELYGGNAVFVGDGDHHEVEFDEFAQSFLFGSDLMEPISSPTYMGRPLERHFCPYTFTVYPSQELKDQYVTDKPVLYSVVVCLVFVFSALVFVAYDCLVERRQRVVMSSATTADAVVSSLFPTKVKEQLYETELTGKNKLDGSHNESTSRTFTTQSVMDGPPIADLYPETTIMFADLVGFTKWSSSRPPSDVFLLLETIYGAFDKVAQRRKVFKVETIGDCYVAVAGLPKPQTYHAVIMAKFAAECRWKMQTELYNLLDTLGSDVLGLQLRIGLHSGPVTAGVLRGDKARFQLFGDSMNTCARMETNSQPNRILASEATAKLLSEAGKEQWVKPREELIEAKGKGLMQTYWVESGRHSHSVVTRDSMLDTISMDTSENSGERAGPGRQNNSMRMSDISSYSGALRDYDGYDIVMEC